MLVCPNTDILEGKSAKPPPHGNTRISHDSIQGDSLRKEETRQKLKHRVGIEQNLQQPRAEKRKRSEPLI